ncbi:MAG: hypothetical protein IPK75_18870 [Acidobacteria bacterium]|nr:hypothetical protein [Acidobacteriota bacterium]
MFISPGKVSPRRWSASATGLLATTNGDGVEKTVGRIVIPANTLAVDGDAIDLTFAAAYLNNTGSNQSPQLGISRNLLANWYMGSAQTVVATHANLYVFLLGVRIDRTSSTTANVTAGVTVTLLDGSASVSGFGTRYGSLTVGGAVRGLLSIGAPMDWTIENTIKFKAILATNGTPALHQITGLTGRGILLT